MGDAGALVTDDDELAEAMRALREHGQTREVRHADVGWTARLDTIHAAVLLRKLPYLDEWNAQRRAAADLYIEGLAGVGDLTLPDSSDRGQVWHLFVVRTHDRDGLADHLAASNIGTGCHYPEPPYLSDAYAQLGYAEGSFPVAERIAREALSLPMFPGITEAADRTGCREHPRLVRPWLTGRSTTPRIAPSSVSSSATKSSSSRSRTSTGARSATTRGSAHSSRSSAER